MFLFCGSLERNHKRLARSWLSESIDSSDLKAGDGAAWERTLSFLFIYCFQAVAYVIWFEMNARRVGEPLKPSNLMILYLDKLVQNKISSLRRTVASKHEKAMTIWFGRR